MALWPNLIRHCLCIHHIGGSQAGMLRTYDQAGGARRNRLGEWADTASVPAGSAPHAWILPRVAGEMDGRTPVFAFTGAPAPGGVALRMAGIAAISFTATAAPLGAVAPMSGFASFSFAGAPATLGGAALMSGFGSFAFSGGAANLGAIAPMTGFASFAFAGFGNLKGQGRMEGQWGGPTPLALEVASAVLAAAQATPIHADVRRVIGGPIDGEGTEANPWGPA